MAPVLIPRGDKKLFKESMVKREEKEGTNKKNTRRSYMYLISLRLVSRKIRAG